MYSRAARLVREQKVGKGWHSVADEKELVGRGEVGFERSGGRGEEEKPSEKRGEREGVRGGVERGERIQLRMSGRGRREKYRKRGRSVRCEREREKRERASERERERGKGTRERAVCMHRSFISRRNRGKKKGEKVSRVRYAE